MLQITVTINNRERNQVNFCVPIGADKYEITRLLDEEFGSDGWKWYE